MLYRSLIYPFLVYAVHVWGLTFSSYLSPQYMQLKSYLSQNLDDPTQGRFSNLLIYLTSMISINFQVLSTVCQ